MAGLADDARLAIRGLRASPQASLAAVATLALAIGANGAAFSLVNGLLIRDLPVDRPEQLATVSSDFAISHGFTAGAGFSYAMWERLRDRAGLFGGALAWHPRDVTLERGAGSIAGHGLYVSGSFFRTLGVAAAHGRIFTSDDDVRGDAALVGVISDRFWLRQFGRDTTVIGSPLNVDGVPVTIIGVAPPAFDGLEPGRTFDIALPIGAQAVIGGKNAALFQERAALLLVMIRLKVGQSVESATRTLRLLQPDIVPDRASPLAREPFTLVPAAGGAANPGSPQRLYERPLWMLMFGVAVVLVIACVNVANLQLARAASRSHDIGIRVALGATRWRLARMQLVDALLLAVAGAVTGLLLAFVGSRAIVALTPVVSDFIFDWRLALFTATVTVATALFVGLAPAIGAARMTAGEALRADGRGVTPRRPQRLSAALTVLQIALAMVLVLAAALLGQTFTRLARLPLGFDADRLVVMTVNTAKMEIEDGARLVLYERLVESAAGVPGVERAAASMWTPFSAGGLVVTMDASELPGATAVSQKADVVSNFVTPGWFGVYGIPIKHGRDFNAQDNHRAAPVLIVNEAFVRQFAGGRNLVGAITSGGRHIVGVVGDAVSRSAQRIPGITSLALREPVPPTMYMPLAQTASADRPPSAVIRITIRPSGRSTSIALNQVRAAVADVDPALTVTTRLMEDHLSEALAQERLLAGVSVFFGGMALFLACIGLYGLMSYAVSLRTREMGLRLALGAARSVVVGHVLRRGLVLILAGSAVGLTGAFLFTKMLADLLFGVSPVDPATFVVVTVLLAVVGILALLVPALRASRVDPASALRAA